QLFEAFAETFELSSARTLQPGKAFGREARDFVEHERAVFGQRVADPKFSVTDQPHDVARKCLVHGLAVAAKKLVRAGKAQFFACAGVDDVHIALETAGTNAHEGKTVAMFGVHVRLDLENKTGKALVVRGDDPL